MSALDPRDMRRLKSSLALLASPHDGEIIAAVAAAGRILDKVGLGFTDLSIARALPPPDRSSPTRSHQADAHRCLNSGFAWKPHERKFLQQMRTQRREPSEKQRSWLDGLLDRADDAERDA